MPIFEYRCEDCDSELEVFVRQGVTPECPQCQGRRLQKLISAPAGHVAGGTRSLPVMGSSCPPSDAPPCHPGCCRIPR